MKHGYHHRKAILRPVKRGGGGAALACPRAAAAAEAAPANCQPRAASPPPGPSDPVAKLRGIVTPGLSAAGAMAEPLAEAELYKKTAIGVRASAARRLPHARAAACACAS